MAMRISAREVRGRELHQLLAGNHRMRHKDLLRPRIHHHFGFTGLGDGEPPRNRAATVCARRRDSCGS